MASEIIDKCPENFTFNRKFQVPSGTVRENYHICPITGLVVIEEHRTEDGILYITCLTDSDGHCKSKKLRYDEEDD